MAWSGLEVGAGKAVAGEGLGMEALACIGLEAAAGVEEGLPAGDPGSDGEADSVAAGSFVSAEGAEGGAAKTVDWSELDDWVGGAHSSVRRSTPRKATTRMIAADGTQSMTLPEVAGSKCMRRSLVRSQNLCSVGCSGDSPEEAATGAIAGAAVS